jgi:hypothetical protein
MKRKTIGAALALTIISSPIAARADECDDMAAKISKSENWVVGPRTEARFIPMSNGEYGAHLNCGGTDGLNLHVTRQLPYPPQQDIARAGSILTGVASSIIRNGIQQCIKLAAASGDDYASVASRGAQISCDITITGDHKWLDLTVAMQR